MRTCYDALGPLKTIHARIQCLILNNVTYPSYLQGSIKDPASPRGQKANAEQHTGKQTIITLDIKQFFPSIKREYIFNVWHQFFRCPPTVADCLTKLTTQNGTLPQGTKTSALLANLVFYDEESHVVEELHERGVTYTRSSTTSPAQAPANSPIKSSRGSSTACAPWYTAKDSASTTANRRSHQQATA